MGSSPSISAVDTVNDAAREYIERGWSVVPVPAGEKGPNLRKWQERRIKLEQIEEFFTEGSNIGVLLGEPSGGLVDGDMDCPEAEYAAKTLMPKTLTSGRGNKTRHHWYVSPGIKSHKFKDVDGETIAEIRADGGYQTLVEPSTHPSGEKIVWMNAADPRNIEAQELRSKVARVAVSALIARHLPNGGRHDLALAYAGLMLKPLMELEEDKNDAVEYVHQILEPAWEYQNAPNTALDDLYAAIEDTAEKIEADDPITGGPTIASLLTDGEQIVKRIKDWLGWGDLTPEQREEVEQRKRVKRARDAWPVCERLARNPNILGHVSEALNRSGLVGQRANTELVYLCFTSRCEEKPVPFYIDGPSAAGKSERIKRVSELFPKSALYELTAMSERALAYLDEDMRHRYLVVYEMHGVGNETGDYLVRSMLSEGCIRYQTNESTNQGVKSRLIEVPGPTGLAMTTTSTEIHPENATRMLRITEKDTREHTREVMRALANEHANPVNTEELRALQTWIEGQDNRVTIPFALELAELASDAAVRMRRDFGKLLTLIRTHAILHQATRRRDGEGQIVATFEDYERVRALIEPSLGVAVEASVKPEVRETVDIVRQLDKPERFTINDLKAKFDKLTDGLDRASVQRRVKASAPYITELGEKDGRAKLYGIGAEMPEDAPVLPDRDTLEREVCKCACAPRGVPGNAEHDKNCPAHSCTVRAQMHAQLEDIRDGDDVKAFSNGEYSTHHDTENDALPTPSHAAHACTVTGEECPNPETCTHSCTEVCAVPIAYRLSEPDEAYCENCAQHTEQDITARPLRYAPEDRIWFASEICRACGHEHPGLYDDGYVLYPGGMWEWYAIALEPTPTP